VTSLVRTRPITIVRTATSPAEHAAPDAPPAPKDATTTDQVPEMAAPAAAQRPFGATRTEAGASALDLAEVVREHLVTLDPVLRALRDEAEHLRDWGVELAERLCGGARLLAAGNGGSAAEAQHLTSEFVGRFAADRPSFSAISLHAESSAVTAIGNDYGYEQVFARQVRGHGREGDVLVLLSTSGASSNLIEAAEAARGIGVTTWALTGPGPNPLSSACDDAITLPGPSSNVQEAQLVAVHALCLVFDAEVERTGSTGPDRAGLRPAGARP
jgi:D-sedoheptulose 7-phosphate isomerase